MCEPTTLFAASAAMTAVATAGTMYAQGQQQKAANRSLEYQSQVAENNAKIAEQSADFERKEGKREMLRHRLQVAQLKGKQKAQAAGAGVAVGTGTEAEIAAETDMFGDMDANTIISNAERRAVGFENQAGGARAQGGIALSKRGNAAAAQTATFLSGASQMTNRYGRYKGYKGF